MTGKGGREMLKRIFKSLLLVSFISSVVPIGSWQQSCVHAATTTFTILHTNDFHGQLEPSSSNPGLARVANIVNNVRSAVGTENVLLVDAGDEMQGSLLSNLQKGAPVISSYNTLGYSVATFGNHEFDWGQSVLTDRTTQSAYPYVTANIVKNDTGNCATAGWQKPDFAAAPYHVSTLGTAPNTVKVAFIGVTSTETPIITTASATAGLCFKDPADSVLHYYDAMKAEANVIVVLSHLGYADGGYGYGIPVYGDQTLANKLNIAGKPVSLIVGGHSHTNLNEAKMVGSTAVVQAYYNGRTVGRADLTIDLTTNNVSVFWTKLGVSASAAQDPVIDALIDAVVSDPAYQALVNQPIGYSAVDLPRLGGTVDNMMATFIDDAIYNYLNTDSEPANDIDIFFNNAGGIRTDLCWNGTSWGNSGCVSGIHDPGLLTFGNMFTILPFGNATVVGEMTGAQILEVLNQAPRVGNGVIQPAGLSYSYYAYRDANPGPQPYAWGAFDYCVINRTSHACDPLVMDRVYKVGTNEFLAPAGGDGYESFKYMTNITYWGDMLHAVNAYVTANYGSAATAYKGPANNGALDGRIIRNGTDTDGSIIPITILHHNDSHGNLVKGPYVAYPQLATLIKQQRLHNPDRTLLLSAGDNIQGDAMMYLFRTAPLGFASDGTPLDPSLQFNPLVKAFNSMGYDAMTLGNHEFNFGKDVFKSVLGQATFPLLQANVTDSGAYGLAVTGPSGIQPYVTRTVGPEGIKVAILGIGNHLVPNYELPSNISGLTFSNPLTVAQELSTVLYPNNDALIVLSHIGFTEIPSSVEVDTNTDTTMAATVTGLNAIISGHSHTNPAAPNAPYKYLPAIVGEPYNNTPVIINQAYRYNNTLGEVILGMRAKVGGGYDVVARAGQYLSVVNSTPEDAETAAIIKPFADVLNAYNNKTVGQTTVPLNSLQAFTQETNGANLQADASVYGLAKNGVAVDFHLSGAMTNRMIANGATPASPVSLKVADMFSFMPYENSLVTMLMNGPQLKRVLERAYRNYYYYKYVPGYGGYSYYTTCMLDIDSAGKITYNDINTSAYDPDRSYVVSLVVNGAPVDFEDAGKYYRVSTVNYLAAGSCNFNDSGVSLWPLDQIVNDTQYYVRDAVVDYVTSKGTISPVIENRLNFIYDTEAPEITIESPGAATYLHPDFITMTFSAEDTGAAGIKKVWGELDGSVVASGQVIDLYSLSLGNHTLTVYALDMAGNQSSKAVTFSITATVESLMAGVNRFYTEGKIDSNDIRNSLISKLMAVRSNLDKGNKKAASKALQAFINTLMAQSGKHIGSAAANLLITDANWVISNL